MKECYPPGTKYKNEEELANLCFPEGAHLHVDDWTYIHMTDPGFFLPFFFLSIPFFLFVFFVIYFNKIPNCFSILFIFCCIFY